MDSDAPNQQSEFDFNDPNSHPNGTHDESPGRDAENRNDGDKDGSSAPKVKRTACVLCRKRKLRCDGTKPSCGTCARLGHECHYDEVRKKSGPKRGYVKALEARLAQVETMLKTQDDTGEQTDEHGRRMSDRGTKIYPAMPNLSDTGDDRLIMSGCSVDTSRLQPRPAQQNPDLLLSIEEPFSWDMISLGLEEPLPAPDIVNELNQIYFEKVHPSAPMIHRPRFNAAMDLPPQMRPPVALRYAMWALAASVAEKYETFQEHFYQRARKYLQIDEMSGHGENMITLSHCQTWILVSIYEFKNMYFPRAWMSTGRATRFAHMLSLHRQDRTGLDVKQCLPPPKDWTEREERRRTFWLAFWCDRCSSIGTGWPMAIEEDDIMSNLPAPDDAYQNSRPQRTLSLQEALESKTTDFSPFAGSILMATLFGRNLTHLHRPGPNEQEHDLNGVFWERHRKIDGIILNISLTLPDNLRVPGGLPDPNVVFLNMCIHTSAICLHQAAIFKADKHRLPANVAGESKIRCLSAAAEIAGIMRAISHMDLTLMNPFMSFCLYVAARVFVQYLKAKPRDQQVGSSLNFLLVAMHTMKRKNPLTETFLAQLEVDMESAGMQNPAAESTMESMLKKGMPEFKIDENFQQKREESKVPSMDGSPGPPFHVAQHQDLNPSKGHQPARSVGTPASMNSERIVPIGGGGRNRATPQNADERLTFEYHRIPASSLGIPNPEINPFEAPTVQMDLSPDNSNTDNATSSSNNPSLSGASPLNNASSAFTPPQSDTTPGDSSSNRGASHSSWQQINNNGTNGHTPAGFVFSDTGHDTSMPSSFSPSAAGVNVSADEFSNFTAQFFPPTPNMDTDAMQGWDMSGNGNIGTGTGFTPTASSMSNESWAQLMEGMSGWDGGRPHPWSLDNVQ